jgi:hypothetical protein
MTEKDRLEAEAMTSTLISEPPALADLEDDAELEARIVMKALKTGFQGRVTYRQGDYIEGVALARNVGHGDIALKLSRYVAPGAPLQLELDCLMYRGLPIRMNAEVESCAPDKDGKSFIAFVHVSRHAVRA